VISVCACVALAGYAQAETKVVVKGVHLCCPACIQAVSKTLKQDGVRATCDQKAKTITITASDDAAAQKALDDLAAAGFHGDTENKDLAMKEDSGASAGKVQRVTLTGVHNCCGACCRAVKATVKKVPGVQGDTARPRTGTFEVSGDFDATELVKALNAAGFHVKVKP
jgi:copper chaperone CopZ